MQPLDEFLLQHRHPTVELLASFVRLYINEQWQQVLRSNREVLLGLFGKFGEGAAYGTYAQRLFRPIQGQLNYNGFVVSPSFPGTLATSREWEPLRARERWMWSVVKRDQGEIFRNPRRLPFSRPYAVPYPASS